MPKQWARQLPAADIVVRLSHGIWRSGLLLQAQSRLGRLRGIHAVPQGWGILLQAQSVHGWGLRDHLTVIGIDDRGRVTHVRDLAPLRFVTCRGVTWIAELRAGAETPPVGAVLDLEVMRRRGRLWPIS